MYHKTQLHRCIHWPRSVQNIDRVTWNDHVRLAKRIDPSKVIIHLCRRISQWWSTLLAATDSRLGSGHISLELFVGAATIWTPTFLYLWLMPKRWALLPLKMILTVHPPTHGLPCANIIWMFQKVMKSDQDLCSNLRFWIKQCSKLCSNLRF